MDRHLPLGTTEDKRDMCDNPVVDTEAIEG